MASIHDKLNRVRKPRVHITYDLESNGESVKRELPFVMGVMGDYSGDNTNQKAFKDRNFLQVDRDNINEIMNNINPQLNMKVENTLQGDGTEMSVNLSLNHLEDFEPHRVVEQVEPLRKLLEARNKLRDLLSKADRSEELEKVLEDILSNTDALNSLKGELGINEETK
ncbi:MAG TPA: type VI secretion system contractile sheath small subunit [Cellvibrionaceae bacterium]|nr:type VI secretion system contractile sheath small subunit [Cellvibrionaceae bacterium]HMW72238.1 type VI secretion system contractile sheath small subunit [Cellvibrionaceae bacterium]HMY40217.1 type VI secretion system contractile sheath small subunit [Marinagarivorans sp.]HNG59447.1 type VI secretion system contractile sheath small subunit [Cellvibrionaceae bacterium]